MFNIESKVIVVTGGEGLIGRNIVEHFRAYGAIVYSADINFAKEGSFNIILDITNENSVRIAIEKILIKHNRIDAWINNAYPRTSDWGNNIEDVIFASWRKNIDMHLNGYFICSKLILNQMKLQKYGSLINMSSIYGLVGPDFSIYEGTGINNPVAYSAIKGGINNLTRYLASYYGPFNIRINTISPGGIFDNQNELFVNNYCEKVPLRRMGSTNDIISSIHFLISDESSYITGHNLVIDGGWTII